MSRLKDEPSSQLILTINGGSSSIKFALFATCNPPQRRLSGQIERIGQPGTTLSVRADATHRVEQRSIEASNHSHAAQQLVEFLRERTHGARIAGIGHRVVHGGLHLLEHQLVTPELIAELKRTQPLDLAHLPREIALIEALRNSFPDLLQVACFDTAFHRDLPRVAQLLPIPRSYDAAGVRRFGFHGLSYSYLMDELRRVAGNEAANGRVILAHLGSGASMAAVKGGKPIDTTMAFTPTAGLVMGTRPGDLDPGLLVYMMRVEKLSAEQMDEFISRRCGLIGVSETTYDMRDLLARRESDVRAAEAVDLFCYQAKKWIGALAAAMGGLDTLVFAGGIGEHSIESRAGICAGLEFLGLQLDRERNQNNAAVISADGSRVTVRVIKTDEEIVIARAVVRVSFVARASSPCIRKNTGWKPVLREGTMPNTLSNDSLKKIDAYWRATNYLSVGQIYLYDNPLLKRPLSLKDIKPRLLGHFGTTPGLNFIYVHFNRIIKQHDLSMIYVCGPGHGGPGMVANTYLEGTYSELYPDITPDETGMKKLFKQFSFPGGIPSHDAPETPGSIHEGGETRLRALTCIWRGLRQPGSLGGLCRRRRRSGNRAARDELAFQQVPQPRSRRRRPADPSSQRLQDRRADCARSHPA